MKIVSVNCSSSETIRYNNEDVLTGIYKYPREGAVNVGRLGIEGDTIVDRKVHGGADQAVYLYHKEDYDWWSEQLGREIEYGTFGENLTLAGSDDISWVIGDRIVINDLELEISAPRTPCFKLGVRMEDSTFVKRFAQACRPGAYARVIKEGSVKAGDTLTVLKTTESYSPVKEVFAEWHSTNRSPAVLKKALESPLAEVHRAKIQGWYNELTA